MAPATRPGAAQGAGGAAPRPPGAAAAQGGVPARAAPQAGASAELSAEQRAALEKLLRSLGSMDYFQILQVAQDADMGVIKKAFYRESRAYHPDRFFHLTDSATKEQINEAYKRITEAYYVLRDEQKRRRYAADVNGPERAQKLRFSEASETETKQAAKKEQEEQIGVHPKGRQFYKTGCQDMDGQRWSSAERNFKMALTFEPQNARYKERLNEAQQKVHEEFKKSGDHFKIK